VSNSAIRFVRWLEYVEITHLAWIGDGIAQMALSAKWVIKDAGLHTLGKAPCG